MGDYFSARETVFGVKICNWQEIWDAMFLLAEESKRKKAKSENAEECEEEKSDGDESDEDDLERFMANEGFSYFWDNFAKVYAAKHVFLKDSNITGFVGTKRGIHPDLLEMTDRKVVLGQEVTHENCRR